MTVPPGWQADRRTAFKVIVCFGLVSLFADMTYEGAHSITGPVLTELGGSVASVGIIAGFGEMVAASLRYFSGKLADRTRAYWPIAIAGYAINIVVVPAIALVGSWQAAALLIVAERTGKALRGPARDVLLSQSTAVVGHGFGFGLHAAMDQAGAVLGPLVVAAVVAREQRFAPAFLVLGIPAVLAVVAMLVARKVSPAMPAPPASSPAQAIPALFKPYVIAAGLLAFGFLDFPVLAAHWEQTGLFAPQTIPLLYAAAMGMVGASAFICGRLFDVYGIRVLAVGIAFSILMLPLGMLFGQAGAIASVACWGIGLGVQDATLRAGIAGVVSMHKRGTAFGAFHGVYGVAWFLGSALMGQLYDVSLIALVLLGVVPQVIAAVMFHRLSGAIAAARQA
jgi:MFS family permease